MRGRRLVLDTLTALGWLGLFGMLVWLHHRTGWSESIVTSSAGYQSILQVVPAVVVGVYALALGSVFVIAQSVAPARGTRSIRLLLVEFPFRAMMSGTIMVAILSIIMAGQAPDLWPSTSPLPWSVDAVAVLGELTIALVLAFTLALLHLFQVYSSPSRFHLRLARTSWEGVGHLQESVGVVRQWLCTAARQGQSRDLLYACEGVHKIYGAYATLTSRGKGQQFRTGSETAGPEREAGETFDEASTDDRAAHVATAILLATGRSQGDAPTADHRVRPGVRMTTKPDGWFALQISKALVRATEEAARADVAERNLDELMRTQGDLVCQALAKAHYAEATYFLEGIQAVTQLPRTEGTNACAWLRKQDHSSRLAKAIRELDSNDSGFEKFRTQCSDVLESLAATPNV